MLGLNSMNSGIQKINYSKVKTIILQKQKATNLGYLDPSFHAAFSRLCMDIFCMYLLESY